MMPSWRNLVIIHHCWQRSLEQPTVPLHLHINILTYLLTYLHDSELRFLLAAEHIPLLLRRTTFSNCCFFHFKVSSAFHPSGVGKWVPALAGKAKAGTVHFVSRWTRGVQVKLWDPLRTRATPERLRGVITTRYYTNPRLPDLNFVCVIAVLICSLLCVLWLKLVTTIVRCGLVSMKEVDRE